MIERALFLDAIAGSCAPGRRSPYGVPAETA